MSTSELFFHFFEGGATIFSDPSELGHLILLAYLIIGFEENRDFRVGGVPLYFIQKTVAKILS